MSLGDIYNLLEKMQNIIGDDCRVMISVGPYNILYIDAEWFIDNDSKLLRYRKAYSDQELRYIQDKKFIIDWFCGMARREYKLVTVGEE